MYISSRVTKFTLHVLYQTHIQNFEEGASFCNEYSFQLRNLIAPYFLFGPECMGMYKYMTVFLYYLRRKIILKRLIKF